MKKYPVISRVHPQIIASIVLLKKYTTETAVCYFLAKENIVGSDQYYSPRSDQLILKPKLLLKKILDWQADSIILLHNHPSNLCFPSTADLEATDKLLYISQITGFSILDHVIVTRNEYFSFQEGGLLS